MSHRRALLMVEIFSPSVTVTVGEATTTYTIRPPGQAQGAFASMITNYIARRRTSRACGIAIAAALVATVSACSGAAPNATPLPPAVAPQQGSSDSTTAQLMVGTWVSEARDTVVIAQVDGATYQVEIVDVSGLLSEGSDRTKFIAQYSGDRLIFETDIGPLDISYLSATDEILYSGREFQRRTTDTSTPGFELLGTWTALGERDCNLELYGFRRLSFSEDGTLEIDNQSYTYSIPMPGQVTFTRSAGSAYTFNYDISSGALVLTDTVMERDEGGLSADRDASCVFSQ